jgi:ABC-type multidrug transport system fused ATPase/permease subunit
MTKKRIKIKPTKPLIKTFAAVWQLIPKKFHNHSYVILAFTLIGTVLETAGISLVIPAIALMADPNVVNKYPSLLSIFEALGNPSHSQLVIYGVSLLLSAYVIKAFYLAFLSWKQSQYIYAIKAHLSQSLFEQYIRSPYEFHLQQNSGHLIRNITIEVEQLVGRVLIPGVSLVTEFMVIVAIAALLFFIQPAGALVLFAVIGFAIYGFQRVTQNHLKKWGTERQHNEGFRIQKAQEGLGGIKDVKLFGKESNFIKVYGKHTLNASLVEQKQYAISNIPRLWLETIGVLGLTLLVIVALQKTANPADVIPIIGLFAAAAFRILPSANRILSSIQSLKYADVVIDLILKELELKQENSASAGKNIKFNRQVQLQNVSYVYPNASGKSLNNISLSIQKGECVGLIGTSGAGKSTLVDVLLGLIRPESGEVLIDGQNINESMRSWQNLIGYVQQSIFLTDDTLRRNIAFGLNDDEIDDGLVRQAFKASQLDQFVQDLPDGINTFVGERGVRLSGGQRQRIGIARALYHNPPVLIFDEATSALDNETEADVMESIKSLKSTRTIIIIAHRLSTIVHCDKVFRLEQGQLIQTIDQFP